MSASSYLSQIQQPEITKICQKTFNGQPASYIATAINYVAIAR